MILPGRKRDWTLVFLLALLIFASAAALDFRVAWRSWAAIGFLSASLLALSFFYRTVRQVDEGTIANTLSELALLAAYAPLVAALSFIIATPALPLVDSSLSTIDRLIGFHWTGWYQSIAARPFLQRTLSIFYFSSLVHIIVLLLTTGLTGRIDRARELNALLLGTSLTVVLISGLMPALSAWVYYDMGIEKAYHLSRLTGLRDGTFRILDTGTLAGIVTFPSFHTAIAIILIWVSRGIIWLFWPTLIINIGVLISIPSEGGHYLIDILAGALIAISAILLVARNSVRPAARRHMS